MNGNDAQTWSDVRLFTSRLLCHAGLLPPDLAAMLREYQSELDKSPPGRWAGMGTSTQPDQLARKISRAVTDGEWPPGTCLDGSLDRYYCRAQAPENVLRALQVLAIRGELALKDGKYYVRPRDESS